MCTDGSFSSSVQTMSKLSATHSKCTRFRCVSGQASLLIDASGGAAKVACLRNNMLFKIQWWAPFHGPMNRVVSALARLIRRCHTWISFFTGTQQSRRDDAGWRALSALAAVWTGCLSAGILSFQHSRQNSSSTLCIRH